MSDRGWIEIKIAPPATWISNNTSPVPGMIRKALFSIGLTAALACAARAQQLDYHGPGRATCDVEFAGSGKPNSEYLHFMTECVQRSSDAITASSRCQGQEVSIDNLPQTQIAAAALLIASFGPGSGNLMHVYGRLCAIDDATVQLRRVAGSSDNGLDLVTIRKIDDCNFQATTDWGGRQVEVARLDLAQLTSEYRQSPDQMGVFSYLTVAVAGVGGKPATCERAGWAKSALSGRELCNDGLVMRFDRHDPALERAMRALAFLQRSCPPGQPRF